ncbi:Gfo/Idh/MocA family oxidoreductase [uncultured Roseivirga sp.]|uniref:Gfo/Idh/MocA family protein n=1 Tax=uncultured Roseivirga sp. TaxID=543088 RepID=UPI0030DCA0ED|tara:strand:+ start:162897 stop:163853 length:957 start_codon:yes stop_codon:yes gene_type:complete
MNWGFIGFGRIARKFLTSLEFVQGETPYAFASRSNAVELEKEFSNVKVYDNYESLFADPDIDIVYISTTHNFHCQNVIDALSAGKNVLCEKPMGISSGEIRKMTEVTKGTGKFLMEAMWMRFLPAYREAIRRAKSGEIGEIQYITASFGFNSPNLKPEGRLLNPDLAGGALYDVGVYPLTIVSDIFGWQPDSFQAQAVLSETGIDQSIQVQLSYKGGEMAQVFGSIVMNTNKEACIYGSEGFIKLPLFWKAQEFEIHKGDNIEKVELPFKSTGYAHEIEEVVKCIKEGKTESPLFTLNDSLMSANLVESILSSIFNQS